MKLFYIVKSIEWENQKSVTDDGKTFTNRIKVERSYRCPTYEDAVDFVREDNGRGRFLSLHYAGSTYGKI